MRRSVTRPTQLAMEPRCVRPVSSETNRLEGIMDKDKSILERFTDTVKDIANSASEALKAEEPPKVEQTNAAYMPFAAEGLVSDPLLIPPVPASPPGGERTGGKTAKP